MRTAWVCLVLVALSVSPARGDDYDIRGFMTYGTGELTGKVTDGDGKPLSVEIKISGANGREQTVTSDKHGAFRAKLDGGSYSMIYTEAAARVSGQVALPALEGDTEVVEIHDTLPPKKMASPRSDPMRIPPYSEAAKDKDVWTRAWLLLDIDTSGNVTRLKLLKKPGFDLDPIAMREGLALKFDPALDQIGKPVRALVMWVFDWPQYSWLKGRHAWDGTLSRSDRLPEASQKIMCRGSGPPKDVMRDCSTPEKRAIFNAPWQGQPR